MKKNQSPVTKKKAAKKKAKDKSGVEKIIDYIVSNKDRIGGIVVGITRKPGVKINNENDEHDKIDNNVLSADLMSGYNDEVNLRSPVCYGLASIIRRVL